MGERRSGLPGVAAASAVVGGLVWIPVRLGVSVAYSTPFLELDYVTWNKLMALPLVLMMAATLGLVPRRSTPAARISAAVVLLGLVGMLAGVVIEFFFAGGLRGDRDGAMLGWGTYLIGLAVHVVGLLALGIVLRRAVVGWMSLIAAVLHLLWLPAGMVQDAALLVADQVAIGLAWVGIGLALWFQGRARFDDPAETNPETSVGDGDGAVRVHG